MRVLPAQTLAATENWSFIFGHGAGVFRLAAALPFDQGHDESALQRRDVFPKFSVASEKFPLA